LGERICDVLPLAAGFADEWRKRNTNAAVNLFTFVYEGWNFNSGNYLFTTDTK